MTALRWTRPSFYRNLCLSRITWETTPARGECSHEVSVRLLWEKRDLWIGLYWEHNEFERWCFYFVLIPTVVLRVKYLRSWGGRFP